MKLWGYFWSVHKANCSLFWYSTQLWSLPGEETSSKHWKALPNSTKCVSGAVKYVLSRQLNLESPALGIPTPEISWKRHGKDLSKEERISTGALQGQDYASTSWLEVRRTNISDSGKYMCVASNGFPPSVAKTYFLHVKCEYQITEPLSNLILRTYFDGETSMNPTIVGSIGIYRAFWPTWSIPMIPDIWGPLTFNKLYTYLKIKSILSMYSSYNKKTSTDLCLHCVRNRYLLSVLFNVHKSGLSVMIFGSIFYLSDKPKVILSVKHLSTEVSQIRCNVEGYPVIQRFGIKKKVRGTVPCMYWVEYSSTYVRI